MTYLGVIMEGIPTNNTIDSNSYSHLRVKVGRVGGVITLIIILAFIVDMWWKQAWDIRSADSGDARSGAVTPYPLEFHQATLTTTSRVESRSKFRKNFDFIIYVASRSRNFNNRTTYKCIRRHGMERLNSSATGTRHERGEKPAAPATIGSEEEY
ncbi:uncharacterized protein C8R40DRAFT_1074962 [Lentinula edodes]|uniref:uncharacterized protein n=1 Tax=Lentinula edodes TaxID=5353 RepID=UPI001E8EBF02|nr:uncharacterized protein C8R40DRAFT_1074962 [Lentinula edodes]KAH7868271.1 hypothetical protein C8R40DRAFT_1074962 [Lentinula edodes]